MTDEQERQLKLTQEFASKQLEGDTSGHSLDHLQRVTKLIETIGAPEEIDLFIALMAGWLHDVIDDKLTGHPEQQQEKVWGFLTLIGLTKLQIAAIKQIILNLSFSKSLDGKAEPLNLTGQVVQDADRLDAIGALGIARAFYYSGHVGEEMYDPTIAPRTGLTKEQYRNEPGTAINHFYEKLFLIEGQLNTPTAKCIGHERTKLMKAFVEQFKHEWNEENLFKSNL